MKIAIIGTGISGLTCGHLLNPEHEITLYEANDYIGGHTNTVDVRSEAGTVHAVDTGFIVFNDRTYPNFIGLLDELGVESRPTSMGFSVACEQSGVEYSGTNLKTLFAQKKNLLRSSHLRMLADILRFNSQAPSHLEIVSEDCSVGEYLSRFRFSNAFADRYLLPMGAAIWSCPMQRFRDFPIRFIIEFYKHHGLLSLNDRPVWRVIRGGSREYVKLLVHPFRSRVRLNSPVRSVVRDTDGVTIKTDSDEESFDEVIFACHSDQALKMLADPSSHESEILEEFPYSKNTAVLHTDAQVLPKRRSTWSSWNYRIRRNEQRPNVTYNMNILQHIHEPETYCVTLNDEEHIRSDSLIGTYQYSHPVFTIRRSQTQQRHAELIRRNSTSYCGAYWGNGFHEDGVTSALRVCAAFGITPTWSQVTQPNDRVELLTRA
ncbi:FAD-dependent oxidoreductase [Thalassoglobus sp. JC818]|uniref:NAD(P)/FAD-dependent oxidoreductase n=1 Tax=Thalassoglobus sp. JC818 TaxID=3232136 RepID=UPI003458033D